MQCFSRLATTSSLLAAGSLAAFAGSFTNDFNSGTTAPTGTKLNDTTVIESTGGVDNSGVLKLTKALTGQGGSFVIDDLDAGNPVYGFDLTAKLRLGGGNSTPADGFSVNFDPTAGPTTTTGEEGTSGGVTFAFDLYDNGAETPPAPSFDIKVGGALVATHYMAISDYDTGTNFVDLHLQVTPWGTASLAFKGQILLTNVVLPNFQPLSGASFVIGARTGGSYENQFIDNLGITTDTQPLLGIITQPKGLTAVAGSDVVLSVAANNADTATYQWFKNGAAISGATNSTLTLPVVSVADAGNKYKVAITGPINTVTSDEVTLSVKALPLPSAPQISMNFDDGQTPANALLASPDPTIGGYISTTGGVNDSGVLHLADAVNGAAGALVVNDPNAGAPVYGFTASFDVLVGGGTEPPADGFSFNFASDIPDDPTTGQPNGAEVGVGTGLSVGFDIYNNGNEPTPSPSVTVRYNGQKVASAYTPRPQLETGASFVPVIIQLNNQGSISVSYNNAILIDNVPVPGFTSISGGRFAVVGRTGSLNDNMWVDNLDLTSTLTQGSLRIATQPVSQMVLVGKTATFSVGVSDTNGVTFQWLKNGAPINGATSISYTTPTLTAADTGATYSVNVNQGAVSLASTAATLTTVDISRPATPTVSFSFDNGAVPAGTVLLSSDTNGMGSGYISTTGGVGDSGVLHLVDATNGQAGAFIINPLLSGASVSSFTAAFDILVGNGTTPPADGFSFNFAPDLPSATSGAAEDGAGSGLTIGFDIYDNGGETPPAPSVDLRYKGAVVASVHVAYQDIETGGAFKTVLIGLTTDGKVTVAYGDHIYFNGVQLPNYTPIANGKFGFYARTGGLNDAMWIDNLSILAVKSTAPLSITQDLVDALAMPGQPASFTIGVSDPTGATYQWFKNGTVISGATTATYTTPALTAADNGATYKVTVTGPGGTVTSRQALATVVAPITVINPVLSYDFESGVPPDNTTLNGTAQITAGPGTNGMVLDLTDAVGSQGGSIFIPDPNNGQPVNSMTAHFQMHVANGSNPPADGFSFSWGSDVNGASYGEGGSGSGLIVGFDTYQNPGEVAPAIQVSYNANVLVRKIVPYSYIYTGDGFEDVYIRVNPSGTLDVQYGTNVVFNALTLPGFQPMTNANFVISARTGGAFEEHWVDNIQIATSNGTVGTGPTISIAKQGAQLVISWTGGGTLQSTTQLQSTGTAWTDETGASPVTITPTGPAKFYRVKQ
jgi:hypothetical protein